MVNVQINQPRNGQQLQRMLAWRLRVVESCDTHVSDNDHGLSPGYASQTYHFDCQKSTDNMLLKPGKYAIMIDSHPAERKKVSKHIHATIVLNSTAPDNLRFDIPGLQPTEAVFFV